MSGDSVIPIDLHIVTTEALDQHGSERHHFLHSVLRSGKVLYTRPCRYRDTTAAYGETSVEPGFDFRR